MFCVDPVDESIPLISNTLGLIIVADVSRSLFMTTGKPICTAMKGGYLPGNSTAVLREIAVPEPGPGEVLLRMKASTICGSDIHSIYHSHIAGRGPGSYWDVTVGHEPAGQILKTGPGCRRFEIGQRVLVYHISGCGLCNECRRGYMINCSSEKYKRSYGWQRDGGMAEYMLAEEKDLIYLPDALSYVDGAQVACGFGTVYEGLEKVRVCGDDAVLVTGLGPVGLAAAAVARKLGANFVIGTDMVAERLQWARQLGLFDEVLTAGPNNVAEVRALTAGHGVECAIECSGNADGRAVSIQALRKWGRVVIIGGPTGQPRRDEFFTDTDLLHDLRRNQKTVFNSWVTSIWRMEDLVERLVRWKLHPADLVTHRFGLEQIADAYAVAAGGCCGKVAVCFDEELSR